MFERLAAQLREAREKKELTPEALAKIIKMDLKFLRLLEAGDFSFLPELYVKAFIRAYAKAVGLSEDIAIKKYNLAVEGRNVDEFSFYPPVAPPPAVKPPVPQPPAPPVPPTPSTKKAAGQPPVPSNKTAGLPPDLFDIPAVPETPGKVAQEKLTATPAAPPVPPVTPIQTPAPQFHEVTPPMMQYPRPQPVRRYEDTMEPAPRKTRQLNAMQKRMIIFAALSLLILIVAGLAIYESSVNKSIIVENGSNENATDTGQTRYEEPQKAVAALPNDSLLLRMEFSDICWVSVKPDSAGESSENTFNKKSEPAEFKAARKFIVTIGNPPGVRLLLNNKEVKYEKRGPNSVRLEITKDSTRVIPFMTAKSESKKKNNN